MKKMARARKASKTKAPRQKRVRQANPVLDVLQNLDEEEIAMLREIIESELKPIRKCSSPRTPSLYSFNIWRTALGVIWMMMIGPSSWKNCPSSWAI